MNIFQLISSLARKVTGPMTDALKGTIQEDVEKWVSRMEVRTLLNREDLSGTIARFVLSADPVGARFTILTMAAGIERSALPEPLRSTMAISLKALPDAMDKLRTAGPLTETNVREGINGILDTNKVPLIWVPQPNVVTELLAVVRDDDARNFALDIYMEGVRERFGDTGRGLEGIAGYFCLAYADTLIEEPGVFADIIPAGAVVPPLGEKINLMDDEKIARFIAALFMSYDARHPGSDLFQKAQDALDTLPTRASKFVAKYLGTSPQDAAIALRDAGHAMVTTVGIMAFAGLLLNLAAVTLDLGIGATIYSMYAISQPLVAAMMGFGLVTIVLGYLFFTRIGSSEFPTEEEDEKKAAREKRLSAAALAKRLGVLGGSVMVGFPIVAASLLLASLIGIGGTVLTPWYFMYMWCSLVFLIPAELCWRLVDDVGSGAVNLGRGLLAMALPKDLEKDFLGDIKKKMAWSRFKKIVTQVLAAVLVVLHIPLYLGLITVVQGTVWGAAGGAVQLLILGLMTAAYPVTRALLANGDAPKDIQNIIHRLRRGSIVTGVLLGAVDTVAALIFFTATVSFAPGMNGRTYVETLADGAKISAAEVRTTTAQTSRSAAKKVVMQEKKGPPSKAAVKQALLADHPDACSPGGVAYGRYPCK